MEYTIDNFKFKSVMEEAHGSWEQSRSDPSKGMYNINYSSILSTLIQVAGRICKRYASDLFIDWRILDTALHDKAYNGGKYLYGFREDGVDHTTYVLGRINNYGLKHFESQIKELYMLEVKVNRAEEYPDDIEIRMYLGKARLLESADSQAA